MRALIGRGCCPGCLLICRKRPETWSCPQLLWLHNYLSPASPVKREMGWKQPQSLPDYWDVTEACAVSIAMMQEEAAKRAWGCKAFLIFRSIAGTALTWMQMPVMLPPPPELTFTEQSSLLWPLFVNIDIAFTWIIDFCLFYHSWMFPLGMLLLLMAGNAPAPAVRLSIKPMPTQIPRSLNRPQLPHCHEAPIHLEMAGKKYCPNASSLGKKCNKKKKNHIFLISS